LTIAIISGVGFPLLKQFYPDLSQILGLVGGMIFLVTALMIKGNAEKKVELAAKIQEQFDVNVFDLPATDQNLIGSLPKVEDIDKAYNSFNGSKEALKNWYADTKDASKEFSVLLSQRSNLVWDWRLRRDFFNVLKFVLVFVLIISLALGIKKNFSLMHYLSFYFIPILPLLWLGFENMLKHQKIYQTQQQKEDEINWMLKKHIEDKQKISTDYLRSIQNTIFKNRKEFALVPDFIYASKRHENEDSMKTVIEDYIQKLQSKSDA